MVTYDEDTLECILPTLLPGEREHVVMFQDELAFHTNEYRRREWLAKNQQAIRKKGNRQVVHISDFIFETIGWVKLSDDQIADQLTKPAEDCLPTFKA